MLFFKLGTHLFLAIYRGYPGHSIYNDRDVAHLNLLSIITVV